MNQNLPAVIDPIPLPAPHRPELMPSLPRWAASQVASIDKNHQRDPVTGTYAEFWTLPAVLVPTPAQAMALRDHANEMRRRLTETPSQNEDCEKATVVLLTKMFLALPRAKTNDTEIEAKAEAYLDALDDVPSWAVQAAIRGWHRKSYGDGHDYRWAPVPSELRECAEIEAWKVAKRMQECERVLAAVPLDEGDRVMRERLQGVIAPRPMRSARPKRPTPPPPEPTHHAPPVAADDGGHAKRVLADIERRKAKRSSPDSDALAGGGK